MSEANTAQNEQAPAQKPIIELKVSGHLMALDPGLFCIVLKPSPAADPMTGLPGVRLSVPTGMASRPEAVTISTFRPDGWLSGGGDAAVVRVLGGPAHLLVTVYQSPLAKDGAPNLQVLRLMEAAPAGAGRPGAVAQAAPPPQAAVAAPAAPAAPAAAPVPIDIIAHVQGRGDVGAMLGEWLGVKGSKAWVEGFGISPTSDVQPADIEYQAVLGRGWLSPWVEGTQFCGSRGMALPILGLRIRLRGAAAQTHDVVYAATFVDGTEHGPARNGEPCESESLAALESFKVEIRAKDAAGDATEASEEPAGDKPGRKPGRKAAGARKR